ncbi:MAG: winged helix-turn-helix domain-containing protein [Promethearchaeota archaeon]
MPLSNKVRLKILKILMRGMKLFTELEKGSGIKRGHLQYHLKYLLKAKFVEKQGAYYVITSFGLIILKYLNNLKKKLHL